jgi:sarcosine oxidase subunit beta
VGLSIPVTPRRAHQWLVQLPKERFTLPCTLDLDSTLYVRPEGDKYLLGLRRREPSGSFDASVDWCAFAEVAEVAMQRFPTFATANLVRTWAGLAEDTPDGHPIIGPAGPKGYLIAAGFNGRGFMQAPATGMLVAELIVNGQAVTMPIEPFLLSRFGNA